MKSWLRLSAVSLLFFISCSKEDKECPGATEKTFSNTGFNKITAGDAMHVTVKKSTGFSIKAKGCAGDLADLQVSTDANDILSIQFSRPKSNRYRVDLEITLPHLIALNLSGAAKGDITGFQGQNTAIRTVLSGASECKLDGAGFNVSVDLSGASKLQVLGTTEDLHGNISGASELQAYGLTATEVDISVSGASKAYVVALTNIFAEVTGASHLYYKGNPVKKVFQTSGASKVIQE